MLELKPRPTVEASKARVAVETHQSSKLLLALVLLLVAIAAILVVDRQFWFGSNPLILDSDGTEPAVAPRTNSAPSAAPHSRPATATVAKKHSPPTSTAQPTAADSMAVTPRRTVLPPLDVEVVAGGAHRTIHSRASIAKVEITHPVAPNLTAPTNAAERQAITADTVPPQASYPLLAQHMNVQGSVVLQAVIGADGIIADLHVVSGPAILAAAAQQAVREWHFKPVLQNGQRVETMAKIVVNFTIKIADNSEKTTLAESRADGLLVFTR